MRIEDAVRKFVVCEVRVYGGPVMNELYCWEGPEGELLVGGYGWRGNFGLVAPGKWEMVSYDRVETLVNEPRCGHNRPKSKCSYCGC